jgi:heme oxygenase
MSVTVRPPPVANGLGPTALAARLRSDTRHAHAAVEGALDLDLRLVDRNAYGHMLMALRGFYRPLEAALEALPGWDELAPPVDLPARRRAHLLDEDLGRLGLPATMLDGAMTTPLPALESLARGLGCLYVLEGSALGGRIVARRACAALGARPPGGVL